VWWGSCCCCCCSVLLEKLLLLLLLLPVWRARSACGIHRHTDLYEHHAVHHAARDAGCRIWLHLHLLQVMTPTTGWR
jgi:hypothetical protein